MKRCSCSATIVASLQGPPPASARGNDVRAVSAAVGGARRSAALLVLRGGRARSSGREADQRGRHRKAELPEPPRQKVPRPRERRRPPRPSRLDPKLERGRVSKERAHALRDPCAGQMRRVVASAVVVDRVDDSARRAAAFALQRARAKEVVADAQPAAERRDGLRLSLAH